MYKSRVATGEDVIKITFMSLKKEDAETAKELVSNIYQNINEVLSSEESELKEGDNSSPVASPTSPSAVPLSNLPPLSPTTMLLVKYL